MKKPFFLAPMAELSHRALRELIESFGGCDEYFSEMISAAALLAGGPFEKWYIDTMPCPEKLVFQLVGSESETIIKAAIMLDRLDCAGIDLNMGCCAPLIRKTGAGITWMSSIDRAGMLIKGLRKEIKKRLSAKIRIGFTENFDFLADFCRRLEAEGIDLIILHPRTAKEKLKRLARWDYVAALKNELHIPVAGNGDISSAEELIHRASSPCDGVMVGRAAVRCPWIFAQARQIENSNSPVPISFPIPSIEETGLRFLELLSRYQPPEFHVSRALRFFSYFCSNLQWGNFLKNQLNRENSLSGMEQFWRGHFA